MVIKQQLMVMAKILCVAHFAFVFLKVILNVKICREKQFSLSFLSLFTINGCSWVRQSVSHADNTNLCCIFQVMGMSDEDLTSVFRVISACMLFGNMEFKEERNSEQATLPDNTVAQKVRYSVRPAVYPTGNKLHYGTKYINSWNCLWQLFIF